MIKFLEGRKVDLRPVSRQDLDGDYVRWINDRNNDAFTSHALYPHSVQDLENYWAARVGDKSSLWLAIIEKKTGHHVGNVELAKIDAVHGHAEYKIIVDRKVHGKGFGQEASRLILEHGFRTLNLHRIYLGVHEGNTPAVGLYKKLGFKVEGTLREHFYRNGKFSNVLLMGLLSREFK